MPGRYKILSGSTLKVIALVSMTCDHLAAYLWNGTEALRRPLLSAIGFQVTGCDLMRGFGRIAFPLFAFLLTEGFRHTRDRLRYGCGLLAFAFLSEIPWNLAASGSPVYPVQNIFFTLTLGYAGICALEYLKDDRPMLLLTLAGLLALSIVSGADYGPAGFGFIILMHVLRSAPVPRALIGSTMLPRTWQAGLAFIPIAMYDGRRGFIKGRALKYAFYLYYPAHLLAIYYLKQNTI